MASVGKTHRHLPKAHPDVYQKPIAGTSPELSWSRVWDVEGVTSLALLPDASAVGVKEDALVVALFLYCSFHTPSQDHCAALIAAQEKHARSTARVSEEQGQEQIVGGRGVHFSKVISTIDATVPLLKANQLSTGEFGFSRRGGAVVRLLRHRRQHRWTCPRPPPASLAG